jgi:hypothetical protein
MPYLSFSPSAWVLPLKFTGGGYRAGGKAMFDSEGKPLGRRQLHCGLAGARFVVAGQRLQVRPQRQAIVPHDHRFRGWGGTFGAARKDNAWLTNYGGKSIAVFDKNGEPLTPPEGITFGGKLGLMQGVIVTPSGDVWVLGLEKSQLVFFPKGDLTKGQIIARVTKKSLASRSRCRSTWASTSRTESG